MKFGYADDWNLATQSNTFSNLESTLSRDIGHLNEYFDYWKLRLNAKKTVATCFHLDNKQAARKLKVTLAGEVLVNDFAPKYLGVTLDRSLTYRKHTENVRDKVKSRCNIISKLAGTDVGAPAPVLRTSAIALVYSVAEYCVPVWGRCDNVHYIDTHAMRTVSGALRPTNVNWLPVLSNIEPPQFRRDRDTRSTRRLSSSLIVFPSRISYVSHPKDLGVTMNANMKVSEQCRIAASKGNQVIGMIRRNITYKDKSLIISLYKAIVRPHLEYCIQAWNPYLRKDVDD